MPTDFSATTPIGAPLREAKQAMRQSMAGARDALDPVWRAHASSALVDRIASLVEFASASRVLLSVPFRSEWNAAPLIRLALAHSKEVLLPRVDESSRMLDLRSVRDPERDIEPGFRGIPEPADHCPRADPESVDWVLVPGVAFDREGGRLGYGGGYYDRLLPLLPPRAARVAGAFSMQIVERVPSAPHDIRMDIVVTESEVVVHRETRP